MAASGCGKAKGSLGPGCRPGDSRGLSFALRIPRGLPGLCWPFLSTHLPSDAGLPTRSPCMPAFTLLLGELWIITAALDRLRFLQAGIPSLLCGIPYSYFFLLPLPLHPSLWWGVEELPHWTPHR